MGGTATLRDTDLRAALAVVADLWDTTDVWDFGRRAVEGVARLVPADVVTYSELDLSRGSTVVAVSAPEVSEIPGTAAAFWAHLPEHPLCSRSRAAGDGAAIRLSDVLSRRRWHALDIYQDYFRMYGIEHLLELPLPAPPTSTSAFMLDRASGDFSERDREIFDLMRPHLIGARRAAARRPAPGPVADGLTPREGEVLGLVAMGWRNREIAERMYLSPHTVRKHLENVFGKLGARTRTEAVARGLGMSGPAPRD